MKKFISIILALTLALTLGISVFAANEGTTVTIKNGEGREYAGYQLLTLTTAHKSDVNCNDNHNEDCYTYSYAVNPDYKVYLQQVTGKTEEADILAYIADQKDEATQPFADDVYAAIKGNVEPEEIKGNTATLAQGYWLIADVTNTEGTEKANSFVILDTKGALELEVEIKTGIPTIEKKVEDTNDTDGTTAWQDSADRDIKDEINFKLTATMPQNLTSYETYTLQFHDKLATGLALKDGTIAVTKYADIEAATNGTDGVDVTAAFDATVTPLDGYTFAVACDDILEIDGVDKDTVFVVTYSATLTANATIGAAGNSNEVALVFSNDPYSNGTGKMTDKVQVFTYKLVINKVDAANAPLAGAGFQLYKKVEGAYVEYGAQNGEKGNTSTSFEWNGLDDGDYKLVEVVVPDGYNKMEDLEFTVSAKHDAESANPTLTELTDGVVETGVITKSVVNRTGTTLPSTGGMGTMWLILGGAMLVIVAGVFMITRKKMSIYED